jgi:hypothetical protein
MSVCYFLSMIVDVVIRKGEDAKLPNRGIPAIPLRGIAQPHFSVAAKRREKWRSIAMTLPQSG